MIKNRNINKIKLNGSVEIKRINKFIWKNCTCGGGDYDFTEFSELIYLQFNLEFCYLWLINSML